MDIKSILEKHANWCGGIDGGERADLRGVDLRGANLRGADLRRADLYEANLRGADLIVISLPLWTAYVQKTHIRIGCQYHSIEDWQNFTDEKISEMHSDAHIWWKKHKQLIMCAVEVLNGN